jgi:hypothetical protein
MTKKLTREEQLELENISLRKQVLAMQSDALQQQESALAKAIAARLGLKTDCMLDINRTTGEVAEVQTQK